MSEKLSTTWNAKVEDYASRARKAGPWAFFNERHHRLCQEAARDIAALESSLAQAQTDVEALRPAIDILEEIAYNQSLSISGATAMGGEVSFYRTQLMNCIRLAGRFLAAFPGDGAYRP